MGETDGLGSAIQCAKVSLIQSKRSLPVTFYEVSVRLGVCEGVGKRCFVTPNYTKASGKKDRFPTGGVQRKRCSFSRNDGYSG
jgi:hypothetical protein